MRRFYMYRRLLYLALTLVLLGTAAFLALAAPPGRSLVVHHESPAIEITTTSVADTSPVLVYGGSVVSLAEEHELIDEAMSEVVTTTEATSTTTTARASTTTSSSSSGTTAPPTTSPPSTSPPTTSETGYVSSAESEFASLINSFRSSNGLSALNRDSSLDSYARSWAKKLAEMGELAHSNISSLIPPWQGVGENIGTGGAVGPIFDALASSAGHRDNMLADYTHVGIGVYRDSNGVLWTSHVFAR